MEQFHLLRYALSIGLVFFDIVGGLTAYAPAATPTSARLLRPEATSMPYKLLVPTTLRRPPPATVVASPLQALDMPGMTRLSELDTQSQLVRVHYQNSGSIVVATFDPRDTLHNHGVTWHWEDMTLAEKDLALRWIFDPHHITYADFDNRESWIINALTRWIPKISELSVPTDPRIAAQWQIDGPPMNLVTLYEALSRIKAITLVRERRMCSYGYSDLGLIEYGGEIVHFTASGWEQVSAETREIVTTVWTIKEAMVIYYPQSLGWVNSCPSESTHLKNEYYSTIWLLEAERALSKYVPADASYWIDQEIPFQIRNIHTATFPRCLPPARLPIPLPTVVSGGWLVPPASFLGNLSVCTS